MKSISLTFGIPAKNPINLFFLSNHPPHHGQRNRQRTAEEAEPHPPQAEQTDNAQRYRLLPGQRESPDYCGYTSHIKT